LVEVLLNVKGKVVLSGYDHQIYNELLYNGWKKIALGDYSKRSQKSNNGEIDKGEELLKSIIKEDILEIKDSEE
jgi:hypothetical protein